MSYYGIDYWNVYEFSFLNAENKPTLETIEIKIYVDSNFTVESKSLKIYLASFYKRKFNTLKNMICKNFTFLSKASNIRTRWSKNNISRVAVKVSGYLNSYRSPFNLSRYCGYCA